MNKNTKFKYTFVNNCARNIVVVFYLWEVEDGCVKTIKEELNWETIKIEVLEDDNN